jgi:hypothetical protein
MTRFRAQTLWLAGLTIAGLMLFFSQQSVSQTATKGGDPRNVATGLDDQEVVSVTVYNSDLGLIKDVRQIPPV